MSSVWSFLLVAVVVSMTPGPATATVIRMAARDGRRSALAAIAGNSVGVLMWATLSAVGVSSLILASRVAYDGLKIGGAVVLVYLGVRSWLAHRSSVGDAVTESDGDGVRAGGLAVDGGGVEPPRSAKAGWRAGLLTGVANPKLAVFFMALFPQFLSPDSPVLPYALLMALGIVAVDVVWFGTLAFTVARVGALVRPGVQKAMERVAGTVMIALGVRLAVESA